MRRVEELARDRSITEVRLDTAVTMQDLVHFYENRGYVAFGEVFRWDDTNYDSEHFRKVIQRPTHGAVR
jgi:hypothetical protein